MLLAVAVGIVVALLFLFGAILYGTLHKNTPPTPTQHGQLRVTTPYKARRYGELLVRALVCLQDTLSVERCVP